MRLPVTPQISTKNGISNKNARLTNMLKEQRKTGELVVVRPAAIESAVSAGAAGGLVSFNEELISVYGATLGYDVIPPEFTITGYPGRTGGDNYLVFTGSEYVVGSEGGDAAYTSNFTSFTTLVDSADYEVYGVFYGGGILSIYVYNINDDTVGVLLGSVSSLTEYTDSLLPTIYANSIFLTPTVQGTAKSLDAITWTLSGVTTLNGLDGKTIAYGNGTFCCVGVSGINDVVYAAVSADGLTWSSLVAIFDLTGRGFYGAKICFGGGKFILVGANCSATSSDGVSWVVVDDPFPYDFWPVEITYDSANDITFAVGNDGAGIHTKMYSTDFGATWTDYVVLVDNGIDFTGVTTTSSGIFAYGTRLSAGNSIEKFTYGSGSITALTTIQQGQYDFAQSVL